MDEEGVRDRGQKSEVRGQKRITNYGLRNTLRVAMMLAPERKMFLTRI